MLQNNIEMDLKTRMIEDSTTQTELAEKLRVSVAYVNRITKGREQIVNKTFIAMMEQLGYDVELNYVKRRSCRKRRNAGTYRRASGHRKDAENFVGSS